MPVEVILPKVDRNMSHGTLATWDVAEGGRVEQGASLFDVETDKGAMEVEASGYLHHILAQPRDKVPVGATLAWIYPEGAVVGPAAKSPRRLQQRPRPPAPLRRRHPRPRRRSASFSPWPPRPAPSAQPRRRASWRGADAGRFSRHRAAGPRAARGCAGPAEPSRTAK